ncbi:MULTISPECIES: DUF6868 family protein [unclassified Shimia]|uniref:DUF6868 family protein n=1 Tax=unclassified Shimia TaxID=2630038 RepID=UPI001ADB6D4F|nr:MULTISPECIES: hypothetical protein [unclassified Shimia]MBO9473002.1 hypothetical protein [Shimia sp. R10_1]MDA5556697.1 hypothetical protein [Shimia sp. MMG029]
MTHDMLTSFFGWMSVIHIGVLLAASLAIFGMQGKVAAIHARLTGVSHDRLPALYFQWLGTYKLLIFVFALVPWIALKLL